MILKIGGKLQIHTFPSRLFTHYNYLHITSKQKQNREDIATIFNLHGTSPTPNIIIKHYGPQGIKSLLIRSRSKANWSGLWWLVFLPQNPTILQQTH